MQNNNKDNVTHMRIVNNSNPNEPVLVTPVVQPKNNTWVKWLVLGILGAGALFVIMMIAIVALAPPEFCEAATTETL